MATHMLDSMLVSRKDASPTEQPVTVQEEGRVYGAPEVRQVGTLGDVQGCVCGTSCDCSGSYYNRR